MRIQSATEKLVLLFGVIKCLAVAAFFVSFGFVDPDPAKAAKAVQCNGQNLLGKLERENPEAFMRVHKKAADVVNGSDNYWRIEKNGFPVSHLFGTMHVVDPRIATLDENIKTAIDNSDRVVIEAVDALDPSAAQKAMTKLAHLTLLTEGSLRDLVADDLEDELEVALAKRGMPMQLADRLQPWVVATTISLPLCEAHRKKAGEKVLDAVLAEYAMDNGKEIRGLETVEEQLNAMASLPASYHVSALEETLASGTLAEDMNATLKILYLESEMGMVLPLMEEVAPESYKGEGAAEFRSALIEKRNKLMFDRLTPMLETGSNFVGVGALHLPGQSGLVELLKEAGFTVTPIQVNG